LTPSSSTVRPGVSKNELLPAVMSSTKLTALLGAEFAEGRATPPSTIPRRSGSASKDNLERREVTDSPETSAGGSSRNSPANRKELVKIGSQQNLRLSDKKPYVSRANRKSFTPGETDTVLAQMADRGRAQAEVPKMQTLQEIRRGLSPYTGLPIPAETEASVDDGPETPTEHTRKQTDVTQAKPAEVKTLKEDVEDISSTIDAFLEQQLSLNQ